MRCSGWRRIYRRRRWGVSEENLERLEREIASLCPKGMPAGMMDRLGAEMAARD